MEVLKENWRVVHEFDDGRPASVRESEVINQFIYEVGDQLLDKSIAQLELDKPTDDKDDSNDGYHFNMHLNAQDV